MSLCMHMYLYSGYHGFTVTVHTAVIHSTMKVRFRRRPGDQRNVRSAVLLRLSRVTELYVSLLAHPHGSPRLAWRCCILVIV